MNYSKTVFLRTAFSAVLILTLSASNFFAQSLAENKLAMASINSIRELDLTGIRPRIISKTNNDNVPASIVVSPSAVGLGLQLERQAFLILNQKRAEKGLSALVWSEDMARVARKHSQDMAQYKFFSHAGHDGSLVDDRADSFGFKKWKAIGENIAYNRGYEKPADFACERWMLSVSHRDNILDSRWKEAGIGVAITAEGTYYFTEVFILR